jgi:antirestriction protein ArdC
MEHEALSRATNPLGSLTNFVPIIEGFAARGIAVDEIRPRENCLTYHAWRALGRQVRKGEHGIKVTTFVPMTRREKDAKAEGEERIVTYNRPATAVVFHVSQTDPMPELING